MVALFSEHSIFYVVGLLGSGLINVNYTYANPIEL